jgi:hypothetical protein
MRSKLSELAEVHDELMSHREWVEQTMPASGRGVIIFFGDFTDF